MKPDRIDTVSPWHPMQDAVDLKHLGKLAEEAAELGAIIARCIIQGVLESNPDTGKMNVLALTEEIADVEANIALVKQRFGLDQKAIAERRNRKVMALSRWHDMA